MAQQWVVLVRDDSWVSQRKPSICKVKGEEKCWCWLVFTSKSNLGRKLQTPSLRGVKYTRQSQLEVLPRILQASILALAVLSILHRGYFAKDIKCITKGQCCQWSQWKQRDDSQWVPQWLAFPQCQWLSIYGEKSLSSQERLAWHCAQNPGAMLTTSAQSPSTLCALIRERRPILLPGLQWFLRQGRWPWGGRAASWWYLFHKEKSSKERQLAFGNPTSPLMTPLRKIFLPMATATVGAFMWMLCSSWIK